MFSMRLAAITCAAIVVSSTAAVAGGWSGKCDLLVDSKDHQAATVAAALGKIGRVLGRDEQSGLFQISLRKGADRRALKKSLKASKKLSVAIDGNQVAIDKRSKVAVDEHVQYLERIEARSKKSTPQLDWYKAYQHFLHDHVNRDGIFELAPYIEGAQHRDHMPAAQLQDSLGLTTGKWSYVGPHNEGVVPGRLYDGLPPVTGRVNCVAVSPADPKTIYIGGADGGVWKTIDSGVTWKALSDTWTFLPVSSIAIDPTNPNIVYVGTGDYQGQIAYSVGIMKSTNGGTSWTNYGNAQMGSMAVSSIVIDPTNPAILVASGGRGTVTGDIFRSTNAGVTWTATNAPDGNWSKIDVSLPNATTGVRTFWAAGESTSGIRVYKSVDHGATWTKVTTPSPLVVHTAADLACSKLNPLTVYVLDPDTATTAKSRNHIWKTTNGGTSWTDVVTGFVNGDASNGTYYNWNQNDYDYFIGTSIVNTNGVKTDGVFVGLITICMSATGGTGWKDISKSYSANPNDPNGDSLAVCHVDQHAVTMDPSNPDTVYFGNDGGVHRMVYDPVAKTATFTPLNKNLYIAQFYKVDVHPTISTRLMGGAQDNATPAALGDLNNWVNPGAGDGGFCAYDPFNPNIAYNSTQEVAIYRTTNGWTSSTEITEPNDYNQQPRNMFPPLVLANSNGVSPSKLFAGTDHLWSWTTAGWVGGSKVLTGENLRIISTCPSDSKRLYTGGDDGQIWMTTNLGTSWVQLDDVPLPQSPAVAISPSPTKAYDIVVGFTQTGGGVQNLWRCSNTAAAAPVWKQVSGTGATALPAVPVNTMARDPYSPETIWYVGTDVGVFMTKNAGGTWANLTKSVGLPNVTVNDLKVVKATGYLYAATYGRGIWKIKLVNPATVALASVSLAPTTVTAGSDSVMTVTLNTTAPFGGIVVNLASDSPDVTLPATVTVPNGASSAKVTVHAAAGVQGDATLTVTYSAVSKTAVLHVQ